MKQVNLKKIIIPNLPYALLGLYATKLGQAWRLAPGISLADKLLRIMDGLVLAFQSAAPSFHPIDLLVGIACGAGLRFAVYMKGKNAKKAWYKKSLAIEEKQWNEHGAAITYHQLGIIAQEQRDFPRSADFYLKALKTFADANDPYSLLITIRSYARLLHDAAGTERNQLRETWSMYMDQELTKILEQMEAELYGTGN